MADRPARRPGPGDLRRRPRRPAHPQDRTRRQDGFKAHVAFEPETGLFTAWQLTAASGAGQPRGHGRGRACSAGEQHRPVTRCWATPPTAPASCAPHLAEAGHAAVIKPRPLRPAGPRRVHHRRLHHRRARPAPSPARPGTPSPWAASRRRHRQAQFKAPLPRLPAARALHHRQDRADPHRPPPRRPAAPPPAAPPPTRPGKPTTAGGGPWSNAPSPGCRPRQPPRALPRRHQEQRLAPPPRRRPQPPPADQPRPHPHHRRHLGTRITAQAHARGPGRASNPPRFSVSRTRSQRPPDGPRADSRTGNTVRTPVSSVRAYHCPDNARGGRRLGAGNQVPIDDQQWLSFRSSLSPRRSVGSTHGNGQETT